MNPDPSPSVGGRSSWDFDLDPFQRKAIAALERGSSVLVAAPTGAGKTVVAEHAVSAALAAGSRCFYTAPIKALSNQKYHDLVEAHGAAAVGLLTGDNAINGDAPVVVMTTEVLRNMIYASSPALEGLAFVVLDEVHFLQDAYRGPVWEEVIIHLPASVRLVCLSATVSNAEDLVEWLRTVRGATEAVVEHRRPVALTNHYLVEDRVTDEVVQLPILVGGRPNPEGERFDPQPARPGRGRPRRRYATPRRVEVTEALRDADLLPGIVFVFSRAGCEEGARACVDAGLRFTSAPERHAIRGLVEQHVARLGDDDLASLDYTRWLHTLETGVAAHHAGMVPPFKEAVEACFVAGLVKLVFATETLALGINMPARSVVIEKLTKFTGERHEFLTPAQYTQLTGRAGRRGIDNHGHAVVLWSPYVSFAEVATLAGSRSFPLRSSFRPTYNMTANLIGRYEADEAHHLLNLSFAQFQTDRAVVQLEVRLGHRTAELEATREALVCDRGSVEEYLALLDTAAAESASARAEERAEVVEALRALRPGDVIRLQGGKSAGPAAVISVAHRRGGAVRVRLVTPSRRVRQVGEADVTEPPAVIGRIDLPSPYAPRSPAFARAAAEALRKARLSEPPPRGVGDGAGGSAASAAAHPVAGCPDREAHVRAARRVRRLETEVGDLNAQVSKRTGSLARHFDRVLGLLGEWGYVHGWSLTDRGQRLVRIFHECDLVIAEALEEGLFADLDPASMAGLASCFTYERRAPGPAPEPQFGGPDLRHRWHRIEAITHELRRDEDRFDLGRTRLPDAGFVQVARGWALGGSLDDVLADEEITGGDFVRNAKQLVDLLRQIATASGNARTARSAREAADAVFRGVVAASSVAEPDRDADEAHDGSSHPAGPR